MTFQRLEDHVLHLLGRHPHKAFRGSAQREIVTLDLHVGDGVHRDGHALLGVGASNPERYRHYVEFEICDLLYHRPLDPAPAQEHSRALARAIRALPLPTTVDHGHLVGRHPDVETGDHPREQ